MVFALILAAILTVVLYFDSRKVAKKRPAPRQKPERISESTAIKCELSKLFVIYGRSINGLFDETVAAEEAKKASPVFLLIVARLALISTGLLTRSSSAVSEEMNRIYHEMRSLYGIARTNQYVDYFQSFLPPKNNIPRCDIFLGDSSVFSGQDYDYLGVLVVAFGDALVNPALVTEGPSAPVCLIGMDSLFEVASMVSNGLAPCVSRFVEAIDAHFEAHKDFYAK